MKASVITLHTVDNYGSAMQTYATKKVLDKFGYTVEFIDYWRKDNLPEYRAKQLLQSRILQKFKFLWGINKYSQRVATLTLSLILKNRKSVMQKFLEKHIQLTDCRYNSYDELKKNPPLADIYITGSDQVWNKIWNQGIDKAYFLDFAPAGKPRISFAASIGRNHLDEDEILETMKLLKKYDAISVREQSAVDLLSSMGIPSTLILDPTLMLKAEEWKKIAVKVEFDRPYLLIYQLNPNPQMDIYAKKIAQKKGWDVVRIGFGTADKKKSGICIMLPSVEKFLGLFFGASCVLTDSFHATAFSLNLGIDFISVMPPRFGTRIESILELTGTHERLLKNFNDFRICERSINKEHVYNILEKERQKGILFLQENLTRGVSI
ncbi:polysaccharide pyruvyl transferase family protein [uncultured Acidaminococcus sp.]|uniref:polysaccharide pyruvyl transferase family protein n=1 Tax=uncultured Acidaminococcus sp. TaxID=352152 RepID=UPI0026076DF9|nr:polysaccharide pyruvyl transferase family protein [uncultured Acidaminococcus sp.]